jgi:hypothetical protein
MPSTAYESVIAGRHFPDPPPEPAWKSETSAAGSAAGPDARTACRPMSK